MAQTPPQLISKLSMPVMANNFLSVQSARMTPGTASMSITFTNINTGSGRLTYKLSNTGTNAAYICGSNSSAPVAAVVATSTPQPTSTLLSTSTCDCLPAGAILTQDYVEGTNVISAIVSSGSTVIEITYGGGQ